MTKNDIFYKVLFAIELALLPIVIFANLFIDELWVMGLIIGGVLLVKIWLELFKDRYNYQHIIISAVASVLTFATILILFAVKGYINIALAIVAVVLIALYNILYVVKFKAKLPESIQAVDFCFMLFECIALACLTFAAYVDVASIIAIFALIITSAVSSVYKIVSIVKQIKINKKH